MKKHLYVTLAIGDKYIQEALLLKNQLKIQSPNSDFLLVTDIESKTNDYIHKKIPSELKKYNRDGVFNYNLKYYPLFLADSLDYEYIIFIDADWRLTENFSEEKMNNLFNFMENNNYDFLFERPEEIGTNKKNHNIFWREKRDFYRLLDTNIYDKGHVCNEQFIVFKKNNKFKIFVSKWSELNKLASIYDIWPFAEGVEIGMSTIFAEMSGIWHTWWEIIPDMFEFTGKNNKKYRRF